MKDPFDNYYSVKYIVEKFNIPKTFIYDEIKAGNLKATKFGSYRISESELKKYLEKRTAWLIIIDFNKWLCYTKIIVTQPLLFYKEKDNGRSKRKKKG